MDTVYALVLLLVLALATAIAVYFYLTHAEGEPAAKPAPPPALKKEMPQLPQKDVPYPLPPGLPKTIATIKQLAQMDPDIVANICKRWLHK